MKYFTLLTLLGLGALVSSTPARRLTSTRGLRPTTTGTSCMTAPEASQVASQWLELIGQFSQTLANNSLTPNYTDDSASALSLNEVCPQAPGPAPTALLKPVFTNRTSFEMGQGHAKPISAKMLNIWNTCNAVTMRYEMTSTGVKPVAAIIVAEVEKAPPGSRYPFKIKNTFSEFDSEAWIQNLKQANNCTTLPALPSSATTGVSTATSGASTATSDVSIATSAASTGTSGSSAATTGAPNASSGASTPASGLQSYATVTSMATQTVVSYVTHTSLSTITQPSYTTVYSTSTISH